MAKFEVKGFDELAKQFSDIGEGAEKAAKNGVYKAASVVANAWRAELKNAIVGPYTGDLYASFGITPIQDKNGVINARIGFDGYDRKGVPNALKANALNSGTSRGQKPTGFAKKAISKSKAKAKQAMSDGFDEKLKELIGGE